VEAIRSLLYDDAALKAMSARMHGLKGQMEEESLNLMMSTLVSSAPARP